MSIMIQSTGREWESSKERRNESSVNEHTAERAWRVLEPERNGRSLRKSLSISRAAVVVLCGGTMTREEQI